MRGLRLSITHARARARARACARTSLTSQLIVLSKKCLAHVKTELALSCMCSSAPMEAPSTPWRLETVPVPSDTNTSTGMPGHSAVASASAIMLGLLATTAPSTKREPAILAGSYCGHDFRGRRARR